MTDSPVPADDEVAQSVDLEPIADVLAPFGVDEADLEAYGQHKAKLSRSAVKRLKERRTGDERLVLVSGMTPTPLGEGKTVTTIGLSQALNHTGHPAVAAIREPALGPVFGIKGGAAGGGYAQVLPMEEINLHFTGDMHAITAAHNLIAAMLDTHISKGNALDIDPERVEWKRAIDMNDRALRETVVGLGGAANGVTREDGFMLTAASELMAILALTTDLPDLKDRVGDVIVGYTRGDDPVTVDDLEATGAVAALLRDAIKPNVVQTTAGTPALIHAGPFANIAHGTNSVIADQVGLGMADWVVTEAGFGSELGAEKFMHVVSRIGDVTPDVAVVVASCRALKYHGKNMWPPDTDALEETDVAALEAGLDNLDHHVTNLRQFGLPVVVAVNKFPFDADAELAAVTDRYADVDGVRVAVSEVHAKGAAGGTELVEAVTAATADAQNIEYRYPLTAPITEKIETVATEVYGADGVNYVDGATADIERMSALGFDDLPVVVSKTFHSLSDDPSRKGVPEDWTLDVSAVYPAAGAGFLVVLTDDVLVLPGLPERPAAADIDVDKDGSVTGLF